MMRPIQKPEWLLYAAEVRKQLSEMSDTKSGKRSERHVQWTYLKACDQMGYHGSLSDWEYLLGRRRPRNW